MWHGTNHVTFLNLMFCPLLLLFFQYIISLCNPGSWAGLESVRCLPAFALWVLGVKACTTSVGLLLCKMVSKCIHNYLILSLFLLKVSKVTPYKANFKLVLFICLDFLPNVDDVRSRKKTDKEKRQQQENRQTIRTVSSTAPWCWTRMTDVCGWLASETASLFVLF